MIFPWLIFAFVLLALMILLLSPSPRFRTFTGRDVVLVVLSVIIIILIVLMVTDAPLIR